MYLYFVCFFVFSSDSYEDSLKNCDTSLNCRRKLKPPPVPIATNNNSSTINNKQHGFQRSIKNPKIRHGMRHSFSGVKEDLHQTSLPSSRLLMRPRVNSFRNSMTDLEQRLHSLEQSFREPFHLNDM